MMSGRIFLCFVVAVIVLTSAFSPLKSHHQRKVCLQMNVRDNLNQKWGKAVAILALTSSFYSSPALADGQTAVAPPAPSVLKSVLNDYKEKSVTEAVIPPVVVPPVAKKVIPIVVKKVIPPAVAKKVEVKKVDVPAAVPTAATPPAPVVYSIKPDTDLLKKLEATRSNGFIGGEGSKDVKKVETKEKVEVKEEKKVDVKAVVKTPEVKKVEIKAETKKPEAKTSAAIKAIEKVPEKVAAVPVQKTKLPPAVAIPVTVKPMAKTPIVRVPAIPEEKALVEAYNKKAGTKSKLDQLSVNVKSSKQKMLQARSDIKKQEGKMEVFDKKLGKGGLDKDLKKSLSEDRKEEEKVYNQVCLFQEFI